MGHPRENAKKTLYALPHKQWNCRDNNGEIIHRLDHGAIAIDGLSLSCDKRN